MTMLEKIKNSRAWKGCEVIYKRHDGQFAYELRHPSGAVAILYEKPARMEVKAYKKWIKPTRRRRRP